LSASEKSYDNAARIDALAASRVVVFKPAGTTRTATTTLTADPDLTVTLAANTAYWLELCAIVSGPVAASFQWDFTFPSGLAFTGYALVSGAGSPLVQSWSAGANALSVPGVTGTAGGGADDAVSVRGLLTTGGTGGAFTFRWAQLVSNAGNTTVRIRSSMSVQRSG
jgi:hypothetical protein